MPVKSKRRKRKFLTDKQLNAMPLHKLMTIAMRDTAKQEKAPNSAVDMGTWLKRNGECRACFAGSVMRFSRRLPKSHFCSGGFMNDEYEGWARALNSLRGGYVQIALEQLDRKVPVGIEFKIDVPTYEEDRNGWWDGMRKIAKYLKDAGI